MKHEHARIAREHYAARRRLELAALIVKATIAGGALAAAAIAIAHLAAEYGRLTGAL